MNRNCSSASSTTTSEPAAAANPFYMLVPDWALYPMVVLATAATVIASQAVISGAYSITRQAVQLGFLPRMTIVHTSAREMGQIYIASVNWALMLAARTGRPDALQITVGGRRVPDLVVLDRDLAQFLKHLDATVGKGQYLLFITADHGVAHIPAFATEHKMPGGAFDDGVIRRNLNASFLKELEAPNVIASIINYQIYLNDSVISARKIDRAWIKSRIIDSHCPCV